MSEPVERRRRSLAGVLVVAALVWAGGTWGAAWVVSGVVSVGFLAPVSLEDALRGWG